MEWMATSVVWRGGVLLMGLAVVFLAQAQGTRLRLVNSGYENLLVAIRRDVPQDNGILDELQVLLTSTSARLHNATRGRAYFRSVTLLVPETWQPEAGWAELTWELEDEADVRVAPPSPLFNNTPYVLHLGVCGDPGVFIHLTPHFLVGDRLARFAQFGDEGKLLVHEFAQYRWGVFEEHGIQGDPQNPLFFRDDENNIRPTGCVRGIRGIFEDRVTGGGCSVNVTSGLPDENCVFFAELSDVNDAAASLMYITFLPTIRTFCEGGTQDELHRHDPWAPNMQNRRCNRRGAWDVIAMHPDFRNYNNPPVLGQNTTPSFKIVRATPQTPGQRCRSRVVLVLDISSSIIQEGRFFPITQTAAQFLLQLPRGAQVSIVTFNNKVKVLAGLTEITSDATNARLAGELPPRSSHRTGTAIGLGVQMAFEVLRSAGGLTARDRVVLFTDGKETSRPTISQVLQQVPPTPVRIHTLAYGKDATPDLRTLSEKTGGLYFYHLEMNNATDLVSAVAQMISSLPDCRDARTTQLAARVERVEGGVTATTGEVYVDRMAGDRLLLAFFAPEQKNFSVAVTSPSGRTYTENSSEANYYTAFNMRTFSIAPVEEGTWRYALTSANDAVPVTLTAQGRAYVTSDVVNVESWVNSFQADISKGDYPALFANVHQADIPIVKAKVTALVRGPNSDIVSVPMQDNGIPPDVSRDDGVYACYFTQLSGNERYSVETEVDVQNGTAYLLTLDDQPGTLTKRVYPGLVEVPSHRLQPAGRFLRRSAAGAFEVTGYVPSVDIFPPAEVADLRVTSIQAAERAVTLEWTAVGDDLTHGTATRYELRVADSFQAIRSNFSTAALVTPDMILDGDLDPLPSGSLQRVKVNVTSMATQRAVIFGVRAMDDAGLFSRVGSPAAASLLPPSFPQSVGQDPLLPQTSSGNSSSAQSCFPSTCRLVLAGVTTAIAATLYLKWLR